MPTNTALLKAKIVECGLTQEQVAQQLGISYQALSNKINNKVDFKASEIQLISKILKITDYEPYFFCTQNSQNG